MMDTVTTESELPASQDKKVYTFELTADQRTLIMWTGIAIEGYFLISHLINKAVKGIRDD